MILIKLDGRRVRAPNPTPSELLRHAERYGVDCVAETAAEFMEVDELASLIARLDVIELRRDSKRRYSQVPKRRKSAEERAKRLLGIEDEAEETPSEDNR